LALLDLPRRSPFMSVNSRTREANVVATFDSQYDADEAILELRLAGFRDRQIGYFTHAPDGTLSDLLERNHWLSGAALGAIAGVAIGVGVSRIVPAWGLDPLGLLITCAVFGMLFVGTIGGLIGEAIPRRRVAAPAIGPTDGPLVVAVSAGADNAQAAEVLRHRAGHVTAVGTTLATGHGHIAAHHV
jgi:rhodanese-related sulfurtransferase